MMINNKLGLTSSYELREAEERLTKEKALALYDKKAVAHLPVGSFAQLAAIHEYLFSDVYDFAGKIRDVNIIKSHFRFTSILYIHTAIEAVEQMTMNDVEAIIKKYVEMNVIHPFREGNGRSMRIWLNLMLEEKCGLVVDWQRIDKEDYLSAMERSVINDLELQVLIKGALSRDVHNRMLYMKGIDKSYDYEGYDLYTMTSLDNKKKR